MEGEIPTNNADKNQGEIDPELAVDDNLTPPEAPAREETIQNTPKTGPDNFDPNEPISIPGIHEPETPENTPDIRSEAQKEFEARKQEIETDYENRMRDWNAVKAELEQSTGYSLERLKDIMRDKNMGHFFRGEGSPERIADIIKTLDEKKGEIDDHRRQTKEKLLQEFASSI